MKFKVKLIKNKKFRGLESFFTLGFQLICSDSSKIVKYGGGFPKFGNLRYETFERYHYLSLFCNK